jgi:hypothetical protein
LHGRLLVFVLVLLVAAPCSSTDAGVFLRTNVSWYDGSVYDTDGVGSPYLGGPGFGGELGIDLSRRTALSLEFVPSFSQPPRKVPRPDEQGVPEVAGLGAGAFRLAGANFTLRMEPIGEIQPYFLLGLGQGVFTFDYGDTGRVFNLGGAERRLQQEKLSAWIAELGFGVDIPITEQFFWGARGRFLFHRWQASTDVGRYLPYGSGHALTVSASLKYQF